MIGPQTLQYCYSGYTKETFLNKLREVLPFSIGSYLVNPEYYMLLDRANFDKNDIIPMWLRYYAIMYTHLKEKFDEI